MTPKLWRVAAAVVASALLLTGCGASEADDAGDGASRTFTDDRGDVEIPADPQRVIATGYAVPVLIQSGAPLVGFSTWTRGEDFMSPEDLTVYQDTQKISGDAAAEMNYEEVAKANPDLIIIGVPQPVLKDVDLDRLEDIAPVVTIGPSVPDAWRDFAEQQADAAGATEGFDETKSAYEDKAAELTEKYADLLTDVKFGHVGAYGDVSAGTFQREFSGSWGTNIAEDIGVEYYGEVKEKTGGSGDVSEYPSIEELPQSLAEAEYITYTVQADGTPAPEVQYVLDSDLWQTLPAVQDGNVIPLKYTEASTFKDAAKMLDAIDEAFEPLLTQS
ncbi:MAG: ABC transporter substrate-binding protein [Cumulibacter sp.]